MDGKISRRSSQSTATIPSGGAVSEAIDVREFAGGVLSVPAQWTAAGIAFQHCAAKDGTYQPLYTAANTLVEITAAAGRDYAIPDAVFGCAYVKLWSETGGTGTNQAADRAVALSLKG